jgi:hypothetical protein
MVILNEGLKSNELGGHRTMEVVLDIPPSSALWINCAEPPANRAMSYIASSIPKDNKH